MNAMWSGQAWKVEWVRFFEDRLPSLLQVLDAGSCREGWLQAEAFRYFREHPSFYCNYAHLSEGGRRRADFAAYSSERRNARLTFLGECKVLGTSRFQPKVVTGAHADVTQILRENPGTGPIVFGNDAATWRFLHEGRFSILSDYFRLVNAPYINNNTERFLFLVLHKPTGENTNTAGELLLRLQFESESPEIVVDGGEVEVRGWRVRGVSRRE